MRTCILNTTTTTTTINRSINQSISVNTRPTKNIEKLKDTNHQQQQQQENSISTWATLFNIHFVHLKQLITYIYIYIYSSNNV